MIFHQDEIWLVQSFIRKFELDRTISFKKLILTFLNHFIWFLAKSAPGEKTKRVQAVEINLDINIDITNEKDSSSGNFEIRNKGNVLIKNSFSIFFSFSFQLKRLRKHILITEKGYRMECFNWLEMSQQNLTLHREILVRISQTK